MMSSELTPRADGQNILGVDALKTILNFFTFFEVLFVCFFVSFLIFLYIIIFFSRGLSVFILSPSLAVTS